MKKLIKNQSLALLLVAIGFISIIPLSEAGTPQPKPWYFAVSADSHDCGDVIMPKSARSIVEKNAATPSQFYWHLGAFRAMSRPDCDIVKLKDPTFDCSPAAYSGRS